MADFQNSFTAKDLERDAAREALLLAVSNKGTVSFCLFKPNLTHFLFFCCFVCFSREGANVRAVDAPYICAHNCLLFLKNLRSIEFC